MGRRLPDRPHRGHAPDRVRRDPRPDRGGAPPPLCGDHPGRASTSTCRGRWPAHPAAAAAAARRASWTESPARPPPRPPPSPQPARRTVAAPATCRICARTLATGPEQKLGRCATCPAEYDEALLEELKAWRAEAAKEAKVPSYVVVHRRHPPGHRRTRPRDRGGPPGDSRDRPRQTGAIRSCRTLLVRRRLEAS